MIAPGTKKMRDISAGYRRERPVTMHPGPNRAERRRFTSGRLARPLLSTRRASRRLRRRWTA